jgi:octaprenyl-diphosphate synthase
MTTSGSIASKDTLKAEFEQLFDYVQPFQLALSQYIEEEVKNFEEEIQEPVHYCFQGGGKRIRPTLVYLSGVGSSGDFSEDMVKAASVIEMVHVATLVHDDILDEANVRHGKQSVSAKYGSAAAVLIGDAVFSHALKLAASFPTTTVCDAVAQATRRVCAGEVSQTFQRGDVNYSLENYFRIIDLKTAELFRVACFLGAYVTGKDETYQEAFSDFGRYLGIAYQMFDDLIDLLGDEDKIGKTLGTDLASGKYTLPVILLLKKLEPAHAADLLKRLKAQEARAVNELRTLIGKHSILAEVAVMFKEKIAAARGALARVGGGSEQMQSLCDFVENQGRKVLVL